VLDRYTSSDMRAVFSDQRRFENWRRIELAVLAGYVHVGMVPEEVLAAAQRYACPSALSVNERERETAHDVVAFLLEWTAGMPAYVSSRVHRGLTSSDLVDTAQAIAVGDASALIMLQLDQLVTVLADHALAHRDTARIGRTHGQYATREVWGLFRVGRASRCWLTPGISGCRRSVSAASGCPGCGSRTRSGRCV
jgi:adenylosuccinate lyase